MPFKRLHLFRLLLLLLSMLYLPSALIALEEKEYYFRHYSTVNGFPSPEIYDVFEDSLGYLWFTTDRGVVRFDGSNMRIFTEKDGLSNLVNFNIYPEGKNTFWLENLNGTFSFWNGRSFEAFRFNQVLEDKFRQEKKSNSIRISISGISDSLLYFFPPRSMGIFARSVQAFSMNKYTGICYPGKIKKIQVEDSVYSTPTNLWYEGDSQQVATLHKIEQTLIGASDSLIAIHAILTFKHGREQGYMIGTSYGVYQLDLNSFRIKKRFLKDNHVSSIYRKKDNSYWFTTLNNGAYYLPSMQVERLLLKREAPQETFTRLLLFHETLFIQSKREKLYVVDSLHNHYFKRTLIDYTNPYIRPGKRP